MWWPSWAREAARPFSRCWCCAAGSGGTSRRDHRRHRPPQPAGPAAAALAGRISDDPGGAGTVARSAPHSSPPLSCALCQRASWRPRRAQRWRSRRRRPRRVVFRRREGAAVGRGATPGTGEELGQDQCCDAANCAAASRLEALGARDTWARGRGKQAYSWPLRGGLRYTMHTGLKRTNIKTCTRRVSLRAAI